MKKKKKMKKYLKKKSLNKLSKKSKSENPRSAKIEESKSSEKKKSIGSHYHKDKEGNIYKYQVCNLDGKGNVIFKCYDDKCFAIGIYEINSMKFSVAKTHNLKNEQHDYIISKNDDENIFKQLSKDNNTNVQLFKEDGEKVIKYY